MLIMQEPAQYLRIRKCIEILQYKTIKCESEGAECKNWLFPLYLSVESNILPFKQTKSKLYTYIFTRPSSLRPILVFNSLHTYNTLQNSTFEPISVTVKHSLFQLNYWKWPLPFNPVSLNRRCCLAWLDSGVRVVCWLGISIERLIE